MKRQMKKYVHLLGFRPFLMIVLVITAFLQFLIMMGTLKQDTYSLQVTEIASDTIRATKTVEDTYKTELMRSEAEQQIEPVYTLNLEVADQRETFVQVIFDTLLAEKKKIMQSEEPVFKEERLKQLHQSLSDVEKANPSFVLNDTQLEAFFVASEDDIIMTRDTVKQIVKNKLNTSVKKEQLSSLKTDVATTITDNASVSRTLLSAAVTIGKNAIVETEVLNEEKTKVKIEEIRASIEPTKILQGQIIVREGEAIDREMLRQLELLGMLNAEQSKKPIIGLFLFILLQMSFMYIVFDRSTAKIAKKRKHLLISVIVYMISVVIMALLNLISGNFDVVIGFLFPTAMSTMLVRLLATEKAASVVTILTASTAGVIFQQNFSAVLQMDVALYILFGGFGALYFMRSMEKRVQLFHSVTVITIINGLFIIFYLLMSQASVNFGELLFYIGAAIISGILSGALTMGLLPFFESSFGMLSTMRLIELSNPNHPLFKKILTETPGTYHHSVMVANLAEAACEAIGADGLLARVASYYHDVGKSKKPYMFIENQMAGSNPHDTMEPEESAKVICAHTVDGAQLLRAHKMPQEIIDIALQHHGTSSLKYFLFKAKEQGKNVDESLFCYAGPKPQTKEAAIISIADSVEAAVRSMKEPTPEKIRTLIRQIIQDRVKEEQFDECDISIKELKMIEKVLGETLNGIFHNRIEYPK